MKIIKAIIIDGPHKNQTMTIDHAPTITLIIPTALNEHPNRAHNVTLTGPRIDYITYKEVFRAVDLKTVLYSTTGDSNDLLKFC